MKPVLYAVCVGCGKTPFKHGLRMPNGGKLCPACVHLAHSARPPRRSTHELEKCIACDKNIDTCCGDWFYGDVEDGLKVHKRCEKSWAKIVEEENVVHLEREHEAVTL